MLFKRSTPCCRATHTKNPQGTIARLTLGFSPLSPRCHTSAGLAYLSLWELVIGSFTSSFARWRQILSRGVIGHPDTPLCTPCWTWGAFQKEQYASEFSKNAMITMTTAILLIYAYSCWLNLVFQSKGEIKKMRSLWFIIWCNLTPKVEFWGNLGHNHMLSLFSFIL